MAGRVVGSQEVRAWGATDVGSGFGSRSRSIGSPANAGVSGLSIGNGGVSGVVARSGGGSGWGAVSEVASRMRGAGGCSVREGGGSAGGAPAPSSCGRDGSGGWRGCCSAGAGGTAGMGGGTAGGAGVCRPNPVALWARGPGGTSSMGGGESAREGGMFSVVGAWKDGAERCRINPARGWASKYTSGRMKGATGISGAVAVGTRRIGGGIKDRVDSSRSGGATIAHSTLLVTLSRRWANPLASSSEPGCAGGWG